MARRLDQLTNAELPLNLGQLTLTSVLGVGSTGRVFRADTRGIGGLPRVVAVTVLQPAGGAPSAEPWGVVMRAVHRARTLKHKGIVQTFSAGERDGLPFAVTELVDGVTLTELVAGGGPLPPRNVLDVGIQACSALAAAHADGKPDHLQLHLDMRPSRVMVGADGVVKLRGFGLAALARVDGGRIPFEPPETLGGKAPDARTDQFGLGAVLAWAALAEAPFEVAPDAAPAHRVAAIVAAGAGRLAERLGAKAPGLGPVLARMCAPDPGQRYATITEAEAAMREVRGGLPRGERLGRLVSAQFGRDLGELTVPGPVPRPRVEGAAPMPVPALRGEKRKPPPAPTSKPPKEGAEADLPAADAGGLGSAMAIDPIDLTDEAPPEGADELVEERPTGAPQPPPVAVSQRPIVAAPPRAPGPPPGGRDDDVPTEPGRPDSELESLDVVPAISDDRIAIRSQVELEPTELPTVVPKPKRLTRSPPPMSARPLSRPSSGSMPAAGGEAPAPPAEVGPSAPTTKLPEPADPSAAPGPPGAPGPSGPTLPLPGPSPAGPGPSPAGAVRGLPPAAGEDVEEEAEGGGRGLRIVIRLLAVAIIVLGLAFIGLRLVADHPEWLGGLADGGEPAAAADAASRKAAAAGRSPGADGAAGEGEPGSGAADEGAGADGEAVPEPGPGDDGGGAGATAEADPAMGDGADAAAREEAGAEDRDARKSAEADRSGADDDVSAPPPGVPGRATRPAPSERASVGGDRGATSSPSPSRDRDPEPPPSSDLPPGSVTLAVEHRPVAAGDAGATDLVQVKIPGAPADTRVTLHSGPAGGPFQQRAMRSRGSGRWEAWLNFDVPGGTAMEYWIVASHPAADADSASGSRSAPHVVEVR